MKRYISIIIMALFYTSGAFAQDEALISGIVTDSNGEPLIGANIVVKDKPGLGTITNIDGAYEIKAGSYNVLIFSYISFETQEIPIKNQKIINVTLEDSQGSELDELVVTGTGLQKKATVSGAITTVRLADISSQTTSITNALAGNVSGIIAMQTSGQPGAKQSDFWIRGISTFGAGSGALVLVDGFERSLDEINIEDIESFSVLKDASATAIYGSRGANGVILITTRRGDAGKPNINVKTEYGYKTRTRTPEFADGNVYAALANEARVTRNLEPIYTGNELDILRLGLDKDLYPNVDWNNVMLRDYANQYRTTIDLSGGGTTARYFVSGSYVNEGGMYKSDDALTDYNTNANYSRWNYRTNVDMNVTKSTLLSIGVAGFLEKRNLPGLGDEQNLWHSIIGQSPVSIPVTYSNGLIPAFGTGNRTNPWVLSTQTGYKEDWKNRSETNLTINQDLKFITDGLKFIGRFGYDTENTSYIGRIKWPEQYNVQRRRDRDGNLIMKRVSTEQMLTQESGSGGYRTYNLEAEISHRIEIAQKHNINSLVKYTQRENVTTVGIGTDIKNGIARRNMGVSGRVTYDFYSKYYAEFNFGYTGSENFKKGYRFGLFPAVSGGWNISEERFVKMNAPWMDLLKVRYSYGKVGNDITNTRFPYLSTIGETGGYDFGDYISSNSYTGMHYSEVSANDLTWEIATKQDLGIDIHILNNKFSATFDIFKDIRSQIYMQRQHLSSIIGVTSEPWANVGKMETKGFDGNFSFNQDMGKANLTVRGNITYSKNKVLKYDEESNTLNYQMTEGYLWDQARGLISLGLFEDFDDIRNSPVQEYGEYLPGDIKYKDVNGDGKINDNDIAPIGPARVPSLIYGIGFSLRWKSFDLNAHFQGAGESAYFLNGPSVYPFVDGEWGNIIKEYSDPEDRWISREISGDASTERSDAVFPRLSYGGNDNNYRNSTFWMRDGGYLRFKTLELGYNLPKSLIARLKMKNARLYFLGTNLAVWDDLKIWDPEVASGNGYSYPPSKIFTFGLRVG
ncbi:MAG: TonB-dependent receptor, partial [Bacteroidales bacterium]|nr:TonB-dependent receptor [Bacteroidales bacterium]